MDFSDNPALTSISIESVSGIICCSSLPNLTSIRLGIFRPLLLGGGYCYSGLQLLKLPELQEIIIGVMNNQLIFESLSKCHRLSIEKFIYLNRPLDLGELPQLKEVSLGYNDHVKIIFANPFLESINLDYVGNKVEFDFLVDPKLLKTLNYKPENIHNPSILEKLKQLETQITARNAMILN